eukprot:15344122-Ditylum_brightwellii.AAC.2
MHTLDTKLNSHRREFMTKRLMCHAEEFKQLAEEQYRGRSNAAITDCNAKACYNRILPQLDMGSQLRETQA